VIIMWRDDPRVLYLFQTLKSLRPKFEWQVRKSLFIVFECYFRISDSEPKQTRSLWFDWNDNQIKSVQGNWFHLDFTDNEQIERTLTEITNAF
jgi:hypothetical protein